MSSREKNNNLQFGLTIPQGWRGGDLPLEEENNPVKQYEFSKSVAIAADSLGFHSIYAYDHLIPHYKDDIEKNILECRPINQRRPSTSCKYLRQGTSNLNWLWACGDY